MLILMYTDPPSLQFDIVELLVRVERDVNSTCTSRQVTKGEEEAVGSGQTITEEIYDQSVPWRCYQPVSQVTRDAK